MVRMRQENGVAQNMASVLAKDYTLPVFEAVVCGLTLKQTGQGEADQTGGELLRLTANWQAKHRQVTELFSETDFSNVSKDQIAVTHAGLTVLVMITHPMTQIARSRLPGVPEPYRSAIAAMLDDIDAGADKLEEVLEAWSMALDPALLADIGLAVKEARVGKKKEDIPNWRDVLASVRH